MKNSTMFATMVTIVTVGFLVSAGISVFTGRTTVKDNLDGLAYIVGANTQERVAANPTDIFAEPLMGLDDLVNFEIAGDITEEAEIESDEKEIGIARRDVILSSYSTATPKVTLVE